MRSYEINILVCMAREIRGVIRIMDLPNLYIYAYGYMYIHVAAVFDWAASQTLQHNGAK